MKSFEIEVFIDGEPTYMVDIPLSQSSEAAERAAKFAIMSRHRQMDMDRIEARWTGKSESIG